MFGNNFITNSFNIRNIITKSNDYLNVINRAIPLFQKIKPSINNSLNMFKKISNTKPVETKKRTIKNIEDSLPTFFQ
jgi:hypothetical protein